MNEIDWSKYFDHIYCIHFLPYKERRKEIEEELKRVGILYSKIFSWKYTFSSPFDQQMMDNPLFRRMQNNKRFTVGAYNLAMAHYSIMKESLELGYSRILIIEDDIAFLKDKTEIYTILENMPKDDDIIMFDKVGIRQEDYDDCILHRKINDYYARYDLLWTTACISLNKRGMAHISNCQEKKFCVADFYTNAFSPTTGMRLQHDSIKRSFSIQSIACQKPVKKAGNSVSEHEEGSVYKQNGLFDCYIDFNKFNL